MAKEELSARFNLIERVRIVRVRMSGDCALMLLHRRRSSFPSRGMNGWYTSSIWRLTHTHYPSVQWRIFFAVLILTLGFAFLAMSLAETWDFLPLEIKIEDTVVFTSDIKDVFDLPCADHFTCDALAQLTLRLQTGTMHKSSSR